MDPRRPLAPHCGIRSPRQLHNRARTGAGHLTASRSRRAVACASVALWVLLSIGASPATATGEPATGGPDTTAGPGQVSAQNPGAANSAETQATKAGPTKASDFRTFLARAAMLLAAGLCGLLVLTIYRHRPQPRERHR